MTDKYGLQRPSRQLVCLAGALVVAVGELAFLEIFEPTSAETLEMNAYLVIGLAAGLLAQRWARTGTRRGSSQQAFARSSLRPPGT